MGNLDCRGSNCPFFGDFSSDRRLITIAIPDNLYEYIDDYARSLSNLGYVDRGHSITPASVLNLLVVEFANRNLDYRGLNPRKEQKLKFKKDIFKNVF